MRHPLGSLTLLVCGLLAGCGDKPAPQTPQQAAQKAIMEAARPLLGTTLPSFILLSAQGQPLTHKDLLGKVTLLNFWAPGCPTCVQELPELASVYAALQPRNGQVIGIALAEVEEVQTFLTQQPLPFPILLGGAEGQQLARQLGNAYAVLPYTVVIDPRGVIRAVHGGRLDAAKALALLSPLLAP